MTLEEIRVNIDTIDGHIIRLMSERGRLVLAAGKLKNDEQAVRDPGRVEQVIEQVRAKAKAAGLDPEIAEKTYRTLIGCFIELELRSRKEPS